MRPSVLTVQMPAPSKRQLAARQRAGNVPRQAVAARVVTAQIDGSLDDSSAPSASVGREPASMAESRSISRPRPTIVGNLPPNEAAARKRAQFEQEIARIESEGVVYDRCDYCLSSHKQCRIVISLRARQRTFHCLECYRRSKRCSHASAGSPFLRHLAALQEEEDLKAGSLAARQRAELQRAEEKAEETRRQDIMRAEDAAIKRRELEVRADEAATRREMIRGQLRLQELESGARKRMVSEGVVEEVLDESE